MTSVSAFNRERSQPGSGLDADAARRKNALLQDMERSWLDNWGKASQDQGGEAAANSPQAMKPREGAADVSQARGSKPRDAEGPRDDELARHDSLSQSQVLSSAATSQHADEPQSQNESEQAVAATYRSASVSNRVSNSPAANAVPSHGKDAPSQTPSSGQDRGDWNHTGALEAPMNVATVGTGDGRAPADDQSSNVPGAAATATAQAQAQAQGQVANAIAPPVVAAADGSNQPKAGGTPLGNGPSLFPSAPTPIANQNAGAAPTPTWRTQAAPSSPGIQAWAGSLVPADRSSGKQVEEDPSSGSSRRAGTARTELEVGHDAERLSFRETDDGEVLASLRDAQMDGTESRQAADQLARALMEAGYARVQVYVNGNAVHKQSPETEVASKETSEELDEQPLAHISSTESLTGNAAAKETLHGH